MDQLIMNTSYKVVKLVSYLVLCVISHKNNHSHCLFVCLFGVFVVRFMKCSLCWRRIHYRRRVLSILMTIEKLGFLASSTGQPFIINGHLHGPLNLTPVHVRLAVELYLPNITIEVCRYRWSKPNHLRARRKLNSYVNAVVCHILIPELHSLSDSRVTLIVWFQSYTHCVIPELHSLCDSRVTLFVWFAVFEF